MEKQKPMQDRDKPGRQRRESNPQAPDKRAEKQHKQNPASFPGERSDRESIGQPVQLDDEPGAERQRPPMDREKQAD